MLSKVTLGAAFCAAILPLAAVDTQFWEHSSAADFEKGTLQKLALSSEGRLSTAPVLRQIFDAQTAFLLAVARDSKGNIYAGGGNTGGTKAKLLMVDASGRGRTLAELEGMSIQAIAIDRQDRVYAATAPDGKVYRVEANGSVQVFYDPKAKYIWALQFSRNGDLFVATGDQGEIHRVSANGTGQVFYSTEEANVRSLAIDANGNLIAGTDPSGIVLRISPAAQGFVLYETPKREVTSITIASDGAIYASAAGVKGAVAPPAPAPPVVQSRPTQAAPGTIVVAIGSAPTAAAAPLPPPPAVTGGSEIYRIQPDGYARRVWNHPQDVVYTMAMDAQDRVIAGTGAGAITGSPAGNQGRLYRVEPSGGFTRLIGLAPAQVTGIVNDAQGRFILITANIGQIFSLGPAREASGTIESDILDASAFSYWGRIASRYVGQGAVTIETRSGNVSRAQKDWSPWAKLNGDRIASPAARFLQYRATITGGAELYELSTAYEMKNVAPVIDAVEATPANYKFPSPVTGAVTPAITLTLPALGRPQTAATVSTADAGTTPAMTWNKSQIGLRWSASDDNGDSLRFKAELRGENETVWKLLYADLRERYYSWDSTAFPDGRYLARITVTDAPSNTAEQALSASRESEPFLIDNTPPEISGLTATVNGNRIEVRFHAKDLLNVLDHAEYSVDGGEWKTVEPTTRLSDAQEHDYRAGIDRSGAETTIAIRVADAYLNEALVKTVVK